MKCPSCGHLEDKVIDSRSAKEGQAIRRRRECLACHRRFTTYETLETTPLLVIKKDGRREPFSREKILNGLLRACEKRPIPAERIHAIVDGLEAELMQKGQDEVQSSEIGERVMTELHQLDEVAYVRFASVYRHFKDLNQFLEELRSLLK
ncbi:MAG TPA: transcriptional regulator NrdR [Candidatus Saccharimonadales bacterium]|jgi:transcriptional repressor NrdR|nr:transcriptional regulator NrdR [Candidatus Saccharimonadales bacterium]